MAYSTVDVQIGGTGAGDGNLIALSTFTGVHIGGTASHVAILGNTIRENGSLGIDLSSANFVDGVTPNDLGDGDAGGNGLQNFPALATATSSGASTSFSGSLSSEASTTYRVEVFASTTCDASGHGEAERLLGSVDATTDGSGQTPITATLNASTVIGEVVTATATDPDGNTSELSACTPVTAAPTVTCLGLPATIVGTPGDDHLVGTEGNDVIVGLGGDDLIEGLGGDDVICGDDGSDFLLGGDGSTCWWGARATTTWPAEAAATTSRRRRRRHRLRGPGSGPGLRRQGERRAPGRAGRRRATWGPGQRPDLRRGGSGPAVRVHR